MSPLYIVALVALTMFIMVDQTCALGAPPCQCANGNIEADTPRCLCACSPGYLLPHCLFTGAEMVRMEVWLNVSSAVFQSQHLTGDLMFALGTKNSSDIVFLYASPSKNKVAAYYSMKGSKAQLLLQDFGNKLPWLHDANIESVFEDYLRPAPQAAVTTKLVIYTDGRITVTSDTVAWLFGALCLLTAMICTDCCCGKNTEEVVFDKEQEERTMRSIVVAASSHKPSQSPKSPRGKAKNPMRSTIPIDDESIPDV